MKIVIHGTNGGYHIFTTEKEKMLDARPDSNKVGSIGQQAYSINYTENSIVFSKYKIIRDVVGDKRTGNVAFSLVIPHTKKLSGIDVLPILDKLSNYFCSKHIVNDNLDNFREDWGWVSEIKSEYENKLKYNDDLIAVGSGDPAFLFYDSSELLEKYFDLPYQEEYSAYKQIFFVEKTLDGKPENPLNALRHDPNANLTGKIDLENNKYKLKEFNGQGLDGVLIEIWVNKRKCSYKDSIKNKDIIRIRYSKNNYYIPIDVSGILYDAKIREYLHIVDNKKIEVIRDIKLPEVPLDIIFEIRDTTGNLLEDAVIVCKNQYSNGIKTVDRNQIIFKGEEVKEKWIVSAKRGELESQSLTFIPEKQQGILKLKLIKQKVIRVNVINEDTGERITDYRLWMNNGNGVQVNKQELVFQNDEINKPYNLNVTHNDFEEHNGQFTPANEKEEIIIRLQKKQKTTKEVVVYPKQKKYKVKYDSKKVKEFIDTNEYYSSKPTNEPKAKFGYRFINWKITNVSNQEKFDGYYEAIFETLWFRKVPKLAWIIGIIAIVALTVFLLINSNGSDNDTGIVNTEINNKVNTYIDGIELNHNTLQKYKRKYCDSTSIIQSNVREKSFWQKIWIFNSEDNDNSTNGSSVIPNFCSKIDNAIAIRNAINLGKIDELKGQMFSESQQNLKKSIDSIDDKYKKQIGDTLNVSKVSVMNLNEVADLILKTQSDLREKETVIQKETEPVKNKDNQNDQNIKDPQKNNNQNQQNSQTQKQQSNSNSLDTEFWNLVHSGNAKMESYSKLLRKYQSKDGDIIAYLNKICKNSASFKKFKDIPEMDRKSAKTLTEIDI